MAIHQEVNIKYCLSKKILTFNTSRIDVPEDKKCS